MASQGSLGERIRDLRLHKRLSQAQLAWPELSDSYVSLIESGKRTPAPVVVELLARKLGCSASYLTTGVTEEAITRLREALRYAHIALQNGAVDEARIHFAEVFAQATAAGLPELIRDARWGHALALEAGGALEDAIGELSRARESVSPMADPDHWAELHMALSRCHRERGDLNESIRLGEGALEDLITTGGPWSDAMVMLGSTVLGAYIYRGDLAYGRQLSATLIERAEEIGTPRALMAAYWNAAWIEDLRGKAQAALRLSERALALLGEVDDLRNLSRLRYTYAHFLLRAHPERAGEALELLRRTEREVASNAAGTVDTAWCLIYQGRAEIALQQPVEAAHLARRAIDLLSGTAGLTIAEAYIVLGHAQVSLGLREEGITALTQAIEYLEKIEARRPAARAWFDLAELLGAAGHLMGQREAFQRAFSCIGL
jgi:tetratricopeptide (TPR) repeat protein